MSNQSEFEFANSRNLYGGAFKRLQSIGILLVKPYCSCCTRPPASLKQIANMRWIWRKSYHISFTPPTRANIVAAMPYRRYWPKDDIQACPLFCRCRGKSRHRSCLPVSKVDL